jgi:hypothetical protein
MHASHEHKLIWRTQVTLSGLPVHIFFSGRCGRELGGTLVMPNVAGDMKAIARGSVTGP